ncbi:MAG TPA: hypothetical protein VNN10_09965 [Dehalococcoidia bacterium]|nr:hypothetical protein [Dehalococcoidia bacterium]
MLDAPRTASSPPQIPSGPAWLPGRFVGPLVVAAWLLGAALRAAYVLPAGFPLNDGGLFYAMAEDLRENAFRLPEVTSYNQAGIPFVYPPLGFYVAAAIDSVTPFTLIDAFRFVPLAATCLTLPAFWLLARRFLSPDLALVAASFAFALVPRSYIWLLMGGGLTRSLGLLFAILALHQVHRLYTSRGRVALPLAALFAALTVLSHLETAWFLAFSTALMLVAFGRNRRAFASSLLLAGAVATLTSPWWLTVLFHHGFAPLLAASSTGGSFFSDGDTRAHLLLSLARVASTSEPLFPVIAVLGLLGAITSLVRGFWFLPAWWVAIVLLDARAFPTFTTVPVAILAGVGVREVLVPAVQAAARDAGAGRALAAPVVLVAVLLYAGVASLQRSPHAGGEAAFLQALDGAELEAFRWVENETPRGSRFLIVPDTSWETASTSEWFPMLAGRVSVATVQGTEWLPGGVFQSRVKAYYEALECGYRTSACLQTWMQETGLFFTHVYLRKWDGEGRCCDTLVESLLGDPHYALVYDGPGAMIFESLADRPAVTKDPSGSDLSAGP